MYGAQEHLNEDFSFFGISYSGDTTPLRKFKMLDNFQFIQCISQSSFRYHLKKHFMSDSSVILVGRCSKLGLRAAIVKFDTQAQLHIAYNVFSLLFRKISIEHGNESEVTILDFRDFYFITIVTFLSFFFLNHFLRPQNVQNFATSFYMSALSPKFK